MNQRRGITVPVVGRTGSGVVGAVRTTELVCGVDAGACGVIGGVTDRGGCGDGGLIGRGGAGCHDWGLTPVRVAGGIDIVFAGGFTLFVSILDGGAGPAGGRMTRRIWESIGPGGGIIARCTSARALD